MKKLTLTIATAITMLVLSSYSAGKDIGYRFILPKGYTGWVRIQFGVPSAPELQIDDSGYEATVFVPETGFVQTNSSFLVGMHDTYRFFYLVNGHLECVPSSYYRKSLDADGFTIQDRDSLLRIKPLSWYFFVGPPPLRRRYGQNLINAGAPRPVTGRLCCGLDNENER